MSETVIKSFDKAINHLYEIGLGFRTSAEDQRLFDIAVATTYSSVEDTKENRKILFEDLPRAVKIELKYREEDYEQLVISLRAFYKAGSFEDYAEINDSDISRPGNTIASSARWAREFLFDVMIKESDTNARIAANYGTIRNAIDGKPNAVRPAAESPVFGGVPIG